MSTLSSPPPADFIGELPPGWRKIPLKQIGRISSTGADKKIEPDETPVRLINYTDIYGNSSLTLDTKRNYMEVTCNNAERKAHAVRIGDIIFTPSSETEEDVGVSALVIEELPNTVFSYHVLRFRFSEPIAINYRKYLCNNAAVLAYFSSVCKGTTRQILNRGDFRDAYVAIPPAQAQSAIANHLDLETSRIDRLITMNERLLDLLAEKRLSLINNAVTRGLNPVAPRKPSGISWLGNVPTHWAVRRIKFSTNIMRGKFSFRPRNAPHLYGGAHPFLQTGDIARATDQITSYSQTLSDEGTMVSKSFPINTLVMAIAANVGDVAITTFKAYFPDSVVGFLPRPDIDLKYLYYLFCAMRPQLLETAVVSTQLNLNIERIGDLGSPTPPIDEQRSIVAYLDTRLALMAQLRAKVDSAIALLRERRTALIAAAVTGRLTIPA